MPDEAGATAAHHPVMAWVKQNRWLLALGAAVAVVYLRGLSGAFVLDDRTYFLENDLLPALKPWNLKSIVLSPSNYWWELLPLRDFLYVVQYTAFGERTVGYHTVSLLLYLAMGYATYRFLVALYGGDRGPQASASSAAALVALAVFLLHPAHVETVAYISGQKDLLFGLFSVLALHAGYTGLRDGTLYRPATLVALVGCYYLAFLSKLITVATGLVLPALWMLAVSRPVRDKLWALVFWVGVNIPAAFWVVYANGFHSKYRQDAALVALPLLERLILGVRVLGAHVGLALWPHPLSFGYPFERVTEVDKWFLLGLAVLAASVAAVVNRRILLAIGGVLFIAYLLPVLQIVRIALNAMVYDRYIYMSLLGFAVMVERMYTAGSHRGPRVALVSRGLLAGYLVVLGTLTNGYVEKFQSELAMTRHTYEAYPDWSRAAFDHVTALIEAGEYQEALEVARANPTLAKPAWVRPYFEGWVAYAEGRPNEATGLLMAAGMQAVAGGYYPLPNIRCAEAFLAQGNRRAARMMLQPVMTATIYNPLQHYRAKTLLAQIDATEANPSTRLAE